MDREDYVDYYTHLTKLSKNLTDLLDDFIVDKQFKNKVLRHIIKQYKFEFKEEHEINEESLKTLPIDIPSVNTKS